MDEATRQFCLLGIVALLSIGTIGGVFYRMKNGWGPQNLRAVGLPLVASFVTILALQETSSVTTAFGILGAIADYLFGVKDTKPQP